MGQNSSIKKSPKHRSTDHRLLDLKAGRLVRSESVLAVIAYFLLTLVLTSSLKSQVELLGKARHELRLQAGLRLIDTVPERMPIAFRWNGKLLGSAADIVSGSRIEPRIEYPNTPRTGLTWLFYPRPRRSRSDPSETLETLRELGFEWAVVPYYRTDVVVREWLGLTPAYEDRLLSAYFLGNSTENPIQESGSTWLEDQ